MSSLFGTKQAAPAPTPAPPVAAPPPPMPDPFDPARMEAAKRAQTLAAGAGGRSSTILTTPASRAGSTIAGGAKLGGG